MVKSQIIKQLHQNHPALNRSQINTIVDIVLDTIVESLVRQKPVELRNFGRFTIRNLKARYNARNPKTSEIIYVPERKKVSFKMSKHLKQETNKK